MRCSMQKRVADELTLREETEHGQFTELYRSAALEIEPGWEAICCPVYSVSARRNGKLIGAATVSGRYERLILDYIAVEPDARERGIGRLLTEACTDYARRQGETYLWITARTPDFFRALGAEKSGGTELLSECLSCPDYRVGCHPVELRLRTADAASVSARNLRTERKE